MQGTHKEALTAQIYQSTLKHTPTTIHERPSLKEVGFTYEKKK